MLEEPVKNNSQKFVQLVPEVDSCEAFFFVQSCTLKECGNKTESHMVDTLHRTKFPHIQ